MLNWAYKWHKSGGRLGFREVADHFTKRVLAGVTAVGSRNKLASERKIERAFHAQRIAETFRTR